MGLMDFWDEATTWYDKNILPALTEGAWDAARDILPGFSGMDDFLGGIGGALPAPTGGASGEWTPADWQGPLQEEPMLGISSPLTTAGLSRRVLVPFTSFQAWPGPGWSSRPRWRNARRPSSGHQAGNYWVPNRHMNPLNPQALRRSIRRLDAATRMAKKLFTWKKSGFNGLKPKVRRRKKK